MLTLEMRGMISLLKEIYYKQGYAACEQALPESFRMEARGLFARLWRNGLLFVKPTSNLNGSCEAMGYRLSAANNMVRHNMMTAE